MLPGCFPVHCMNLSCMSCVHDMSGTHYFAQVVWRVGTRYADVRLVFAEFLVVVKRDRTTQRGRFSHFLRVLVRMRTGKAQLSGHRLGSGAGHCEPDCGGLLHP